MAKNYEKRELNYRIATINGTAQDELIHKTEENGHELRLRLILWGDKNIAKFDEMEDEIEKAQMCKYEIRQWWTEDGKETCGKGVTLTSDEVQALQKYFAAMELEQA